MERPLPASDRDGQPWWDALARHEFVLQRCDGCDTWRWPARSVCERCGSLEWRWEQASGRGEVASWIVNHHSFNPVFPSPYVVVAVRVEESDQIIMYGSWAGASDGSDLRVGAPVRIGFDDIAGQDPPVTLLRWEVA